MALCLYNMKHNIRDVGKRCSNADSNLAMIFYVVLNSSFLFDTNQFGMVHFIIWGITDYYFQNRIAFLSLKIIFVYKAISVGVDADKMQYYAAFYLGLHCLLNGAFRSP